MNAKHFLTFAIVSILLFSACAKKTAAPFYEDVAGLASCYAAN